MNGGALLRRLAIAAALLLFVAVPRDAAHRAAAAEPACSEPDGGGSRTRHDGHIGPHRRRRTPRKACPRFAK